MPLTRKRSSGFRGPARAPTVARMRTQASPGIAEFFDLTLWFEWFSGLDRGFAFLLLLPLVVAAVGLWAHFRDPDRE